MQRHFKPVHLAFGTKIQPGPPPDFLALSMGLIFQVCISSDKVIYLKSHNSKAQMGIKLTTLGLEPKTTTTPPTTYTTCILVWYNKISGYNAVYC